MATDDIDFSSGDYQTTNAILRELVQRYVFVSGVFIASSARFTGEKKKKNEWFWFLKKKKINSGEV